jgi:hypothetical protein
MVAFARRRRNSGQVLIVTSLVVVMLLISAVVYVKETQKYTPTSKFDNILSSSAVKQAAVHTVVSALANVSNGGDRSVLSSDLDTLQSALSANAYNAVFYMQYILCNSTPYMDGVWIAWNETGTGVSSICINLACNNSDNYFSEFDVNVTSSINVAGTCVLLNESLIEVNLSCYIWNEDKPALAEKLEVYYGNAPSNIWQQVLSPDITNYGNGTYQISFTAPYESQSGPLHVSLYCIDVRGISVWANTTCTP